MPKKGRAIGLGLLAVLAAAALAMLTLGRDSLPALGRLFSPGPGILDDPAGLVRRDMPGGARTTSEAGASRRVRGHSGGPCCSAPTATPFPRRRWHGPSPGPLSKSGTDGYTAPIHATCTRGIPFSAEGYGVYADPVAAAMQREIDRLGGGASVYLLEAEDEGAVLAAVDAGYPVCIWATMNMAPTQKGSSSWYLLEDGVYTDEKIEWLGNEHCLVLTGYGADTVTVNDPLAGRKTYGRAVFFARWREQGRQAILVAPDKK